MSKEISNQIINGSPMNERDCFLHLIEHIGQARDAARGLAQLRKDIRWQAIAGIFDELKDKSQKLLIKGRSGLVIPSRH